jgi:hypothetical protein
MSIKRRIDQVDRHVTHRAKLIGHRAERYLIGTVFVWFGSLKVFGEVSATTIIAKSVYWWDATIVVPVLGVWELMMGLLLLFRSTIRLAIALFFLRLPGTFLALIYHWDQCFEESVLVPSIQGQYLLKELTLVGAALVIASTVPPLISDEGT